jgi:predicted RNA-binding Zn-ribbon protein involved in translation (DUF1610 family)
MIVLNKTGGFKYMWETIKNDPILKTVTIIILSVLGFGFAFNIMFGARSGGMDGSEMGGSGYSLGNTLSYIFILAFKLLLIALVIFAIIAIFKFAKKHLNLGGEGKMIDTIKKDPGSMASSETKWNDQPVLKGVTVAVLAIIAFGLIYYIFRGLFGLGSGYGMTNGNNIMGSAGYSLGIAGLLAVLLKLLLVASIAGLIIGLIMYIKQSYGTEITAKLSTITTVSKKTVNCSSCNTEVSSEFKFCPNCGGNTKLQCSSCDAELKKEWKCCPSCGKEFTQNEHPL